MYVKICISVQTIFTGNSYPLIKLAESLFNLKGLFKFSIFLELMIYPLLTTDLKTVIY